MAGKIELKAPLDGVVTIEPEDTASNFTVTLPATDATLLTDSSGVLNIGSGQFAKSAAGILTANANGTPTDTTANRLLKLGDFGLGVDIPDTQSADLTTGNTGFYTNANRTFARRLVLVRSPDRAGYIEMDLGGSTGLNLYAEHYDPSTGTTFTGRVEVYNQQSILGAVSQSSGVPTGAIIERGSNANGEYVKFADGTMIARVNSTEADVSAGQIVEFQEQPWPVSFSSMNDTKVICTSRSNLPSTASELIIGVGSGTGKLTNTTVVSVAMKNTSTSTLSARPNVFGFGQWY